MFWLLIIIFSLIFLYAQYNNKLSPDCQAAWSFLMVACMLFTMRIFNK